MHTRLSVCAYILTVCVYVGFPDFSNDACFHNLHTHTGPHTSLWQLIVESALKACVNQHRPIMFHCLPLCCLTLCYDFSGCHGWPYYFIYGKL